MFLTNGWPRFHFFLVSFFFLSSLPCLFMFSSKHWLRILPFKSVNINLKKCIFHETTKWNKLKTRNDWQHIFTLNLTILICLINKSNKKTTEIMSHPRYGDSMDNGMVISRVAQPAEAHRFCCSLIGCKN